VRRHDTRLRPRAATADPPEHTLPHEIFAVLERPALRAAAGDVGPPAGTAFRGARRRR
jgi:hypothetical protein